MRITEALLVAQSCVEVAVNRLVNLSAVQSACQQSAAVVSPPARSCQWSPTQKECLSSVHACCGAESLHVALMDYSGRDLNPRMLSLCWVNVLLWLPWLWWLHQQVKQHNSFSDLEKLHREKKSRAELKEKNISLGRRCTLSVQTYSGHMSPLSNLIYLDYFWLISQLNLRDESLFLLYLPWCFACLCIYRL